jgi:DNA-binding transcriptional LysR family regulator
MTMFTDLTLLRGFVAIVDSGSISAAARHLHFTQSTLSRQLQSLEDQCGTVLLRRDTHRMRLTDTGHRLLADARALLALAEESEQRLLHEQTAVEGNIRIFATIDFGQSVRKSHDRKLYPSASCGHDGARVFEPAATHD